MKSQISNLKSQIVEGFTLIELIIVITVIALVSSGGIAAYVQYSRSQLLPSSVNDITTIFNEARSRAQSQIIPSGGNGTCTGSLQGYRVEISTSGTYQLQAVCASSFAVMESKKLPANITIRFDPADYPTLDYMFQVLTANVYATQYSVSSNITVLPNIVVQNGYNGQTKTLTVSKKGVVALYQIGTNVASPTPAPTGSTQTTFSIPIGAIFASPTPSPAVCSGSQITFSENAQSGTSGTVTWSGLTPDFGDIVALYTLVAPVSGWISDLATTCSSTAAQGNGSCAYSLPSYLPGGSYEMRYLSGQNNTIVKATSCPFTVKCALSGC